MTETVKIEKQVWKSTLHRSMVLQAENDTLKDKIERLEKQLKIAVEQLKDTYVICLRNKDALLHTPEHNIIGGIERDCAIALQQIKELEKCGNIK